MHLQPVFAECEFVGAAVAAELFARGLSSRSISNLTSSDRDRDLAAVRNAAE